MSAEWCAGIVQNAVSEHGKPEIINSDQGSTFTADVHTKAIKRLEVKVSMDNKGRAIDNIFIERLWRTIKYEHLYLHNYDTVISLMKGLRRVFLFYNEQRIHQSLDYKTPIEIYKECNRLQPLPVAALTKNVTVIVAA